MTPEQRAEECKRVGHYWHTDGYCCRCNVPKVSAEPFVVRHYSEDEFPSIKGNGFDGLRIGEDRHEAEEFIQWVNARTAVESKAIHFDTCATKYGAEKCSCGADEPSEGYSQEYADQMRTALCKIVAALDHDVNAAHFRQIAMEALIGGPVETTATHYGDALARRTRGELGRCDACSASFYNPDDIGKPCTCHYCRGTVRASVSEPGAL